MATRKNERRPVETAVSAGGIVYRPAEQGPEIVVCGRDSDGVWGLPKGTPNEGESLEETALREVSEETGLQVQIVRKLGTIEYWFARSGTRYHKWVHYFLMQATGGDTRDHDVEYDRVEWLPLPAALKRLTFQNEQEIVQTAGRMIGSEA